MADGDARGELEKISTMGRESGMLLDVRPGL
jgi:hypothetical protein